MYAIIEDSGTQIKVSQGDVLDIDLREGAKANSKLTFDRVLLIGDAKSGKAANVGMPYIAGATVTAEVVEEYAGPKTRLVKYARRKGYKLTKGHRQSYLKVKITGING